MTKETHFIVRGVGPPSGFGGHKRNLTTRVRLESEEERQVLGGATNISLTVRR